MRDTVAAELADSSESVVAALAAVVAAFVAAAPVLFPHDRDDKSQLALVRSKSFISKSNLTFFRN